MEAAHSFRLTYKKTMNHKGAQKPTNGNIWVAKTFSPWQSCVLDTMRELYEVSQKALRLKIHYVNCILLLEKQFRASGQKDHFSGAWPEGNSEKVHEESDAIRSNGAGSRQ